MTFAAGVVGADRLGIVGVAWGMSLGYAFVSTLTSFAAFAPSLGWRAWLGHCLRLFSTLLGFTLGTLLVAHVPLGDLGRWPDLALRSLSLAAWLLPTLWYWGRRHDWGGLMTSRAGKWLARSSRVSL